MKKTIYLLTDVESTGTDYFNDDVFDVAFIATDGENIIKTYESLIRISDEEKIEKAIKEIGHIVSINKKAIMKAPSIEEVCEDIINLLQELNRKYNLKLVAHNVNFDYAMIIFTLNKVSEEYKRFFLEIFPKENLLDTKDLAKKFFPNLSSYSLSNACASLEIAGELRVRREIEKHSAMLDTLILYELFKKIRTQSLFNTL